MSSVIKSSFVVEEKNTEIFSKNVTKESQEEIISKAKEEYLEIINKAKEEGKVILSQSRKKADKILEDIYDKTAKIIKESKEQGYREGYDEGYKQGYNEGYNQGESVADELIKEANAIKTDCLNEREEILASIEREAIELVLNICEKVINNKLDQDKESIIHLILKGLESLNARDSVVVRVSTEDYDVVDLSKEKILAKASLVDSIEVKADSSLNKGGCIIETTKGIVDVSIDSQLQRMKDIITSLINSE